MWVFIGNLGFCFGGLFVFDHNSKCHFILIVCLILVIQDCCRLCSNLLSFMFYFEDKIFCNIPVGVTISGTQQCIPQFDERNPNKVSTRWIWWQLADSCKLKCIPFIVEPVTKAQSPETCFTVINHITTEKFVNY